MSTSPLLCTKPVLGRSCNNNTTSRSVQDRLWFPWLELVLVNELPSIMGFSCFPTRRHSEVDGTNGEGVLFLVGVRLECLQLMSETEASWGLTPHPTQPLYLSVVVRTELSWHPQRTGELFGEKSPPFSSQTMCPVSQGPSLKPTSLVTAEEGNFFL